MPKKKKSLGLITSLSIGATVPVVIVVFLMGLTSIVILKGKVNQLVESNSQQTMGMMEQIVETEVNTAVQNYLRGVAENNREIMALYHRRAEEGEMSRREARQRVSSIFLDPQYGRIGSTGYLAAVDTQGVLAIHPKSQGVDASGFDFMQKAIEMRSGYLEYEWQNVDEEKPRMKAGYLSYFKPWNLMVWASSYKSEFYTLINKKSLHNHVSAIKINSLGYIMVRDAEGTLIAGSDRLHVLREVPLLENSHAESAGAREIETEAGPVRIDTAVQEQTGWQIILVSPLGEYQRLLGLLQLIIAGAIILSAVLLHLFIRFLLQKKLQPIEDMRRLSAQISDGDLTGRAENLPDDEVGEVGSILNLVIGDFAGLLGKMKSVTEMLTESIQNLSSSAQEIASTSNEQAAAVKEILSTMEDADQVSKDNLVKLEEVARIAGSTKENVEKGFDLIKTSLEKMEEIRTTNSDTISGIKDLGERIESIWEIVNIINSIADQTKIIAFNAELEAAAAGDAGKNFQIVAGEIRRLADGTVNSTKEIKTKINEIQHASDKLIMASEEGTQKISEGWDISSNIRKIFEDVLNSSEVSASSADGITKSIRMQVSSFEQIFTTLKQISESIDSFVESTSYTNEVSDHLKEISENFEDEVSRYTVSTEASGEETADEE